MNNRLLDDFANAIERNDSAFIKSLLANVDPNARLPRQDHPPALVHAALFGGDRVDIVELLLNAGACIDDVDARGRSACHAAAMHGHSDVIRCLVTHRPDLALRNVEGETALENSIRIYSWRNGEVALLLIRAGASLNGVGPHDLCRLAAISTDTIQLLMDHNVVFSDLRDEFGQTPLHIAARRDASLAVLSKLVECGVDLEARVRDSKSATCSNFAIAIGNADALRLFLVMGANVNGLSDGVGGHLLHDSIYSLNYECMILLLAAGADVTARDAGGRTACCLAAQLGTGPTMPFVHAMLAAGADLDAENVYGNTPRQCLAEHQVTVDHEQVELANREIAKVRLDFVRYRAMEVCIGLQSLQLDALQLSEILQLACGPLARLIAFHQWWKIATTVKHFEIQVQL
jgi:ankyrin repeat protein